MISSEPASPLLIFADDWGRHPSSAQHLVSRLLGRHQVTWVNTIGMRPPRLDVSTVLRAWEKLCAWTAAGTKPPTSAGGPAVVAPYMWPRFRRPWERRLNRRLLTTQLRRRSAAVRGEIVAVTTVPIVADLIGSLPVSRWVYYCVDDFAEWPGLDAAPLREMEENLVRRADRVIAVSARLRDRLSKWRDDEIPVLTHGVELELWRNPPAAGITLGEFERPRVVFWGLVDRRLDLATIERLGASMKRGTILLVGPDNDPDPDVLDAPLVRRHPAVAPEHLPALAAQADVLVMPYGDLPVTRMMQPLKLLEYLASGRPVVARDLPAVRAWDDCLDSAAGPDEFASAVLRRIDSGLSPEQASARQRLSAEGWDLKAAEFERLVFG